MLPEVELAKLALLTSKDEEESSHPDNEVAGTSTGSADTDSTLVETQIGPQLPSDRGELSLNTPLSPFQQQTTDIPPISPTSVLGKRSNDEVEHERNDRRSPMELDSAAVSPQADDKASTKFSPAGDVDVEMQDATSSNVLPPPHTTAGPPPLPPRRRTEPVGEMMFGECLPYCIVRAR